MSANDFICHICGEPFKAYIETVTICQGCYQKGGWREAGAYNINWDKENKKAFLNHLKKELFASATKQERKK